MSKDAVSASADWLSMMLYRRSEQKPSNVE
jgi:hypothetical protein